MLSPASSTSPTSPSEAVPTRKRARVSAEHTLNRVRENQRRHRARRRDYISSLEEKLAETEKQLAEARVEIAALRAERDAKTWRRQTGYDDELIIGRIVGDEGEAKAANKEPGELFLSILSPISLPSPTQVSNAQPLDPLLDALATSDMTDPSNSMLGGPPPCCLDEPSEPTPNAASDPECTNCATRPPPAPTESTTLCSQAYVMIQQHNFRGIDAITIRTWLYQGYRRAQRKGEGCRVENGALMSLLDFISGV